MDANVSDVEAYEDNSAFEGKQQVHWDSTSLGVLDTCPRYYELSIVRGWAPRTMPIDLHFGILLHSGRERYYAARAKGSGHDDALHAALIWTFEATFDVETQRPWDSGDSNKNRLTLIRTLVWYADQWQDDPLETLTMQGRPAVELTVSAKLSGTPYVLWGHLDRAVSFQDKLWVSDLKTTKHTLDAGFYDRFTPDGQMSQYVWLARHALDIASAGIIVDAAQIAVTFSRFHRGIVSRSPEQQAEWERDVRFLLARNEEYVAQDYWPQNRKACFRCSFRPICGRAPSVRERWLRADYTRRVWNPTVERGDI